MTNVKEQRPTPETAAAGLRGTVADLKMAERLYGQDREADALAIIDRILGLPEGVDECVGRLRTLLKDGRAVVAPDVGELNVGELAAQLSEPGSLAGDPEQGPMEQIIGSFRLGGRQVPTLMFLRSKCFSGILCRPEGRADQRLVSAALQNSEIVVEVFPGSAVFRALAGQVLFMAGDRETAMALVQSALAIDPNDALAKGTFKMCQQYSGNREDPWRMTDRAIGVILDGKREAASEDGAPVSSLLVESLKMVPAQPRAWAALALLHMGIGNRAFSTQAIRNAHTYGAAEPFVQFAATMIAKQGWLGESELAVLGGPVGDGHDGAPRARYVETDPDRPVSPSEGAMIESALSPEGRNKVLDDLEKLLRGEAVPGMRLVGSGSTEALMAELGRSEDEKK